MSDTVGVQLAPGRFVTLGGTIRRILDDPAVVASVIDIADVLREAIAPFAGQRLPVPYPEPVQDALAEARARLDRVAAALTAIQTPVDDAKQRKLRAQLLVGRSIEQLDLALGEHVGYVDFVSGTPEQPRLEIAPLDVGPTLREGVWSERTAILTSATIPSSLPARLGLPDGRTDVADVGSPFDYEHHALLYCAMHLPDPRDARYREAVHDELVALITAAGGRTLALFTSYKAMDLAADGRARARRRADPHPARPAQAGARRALRGRRGDVHLRHGRASSRASTCPGGRSARSSSTACRSPAPTTRCCRRAASCSAPARSPRSTSPVPR